VPGRRTGLHSFDLRGITDKRHRAVIQGALNASDYPYIRIKRRTKRRVPVTVADTSRFAAARAGGDGHDHDHGHGWHALTDPTDYRRAALGLFWLPTAEHPAGRIEVSDKIMDDVPLAQEVFLAEVWHCVQYAALTDEQRRRVVELFEHPHGGPEHPGEFEEQGEQNYWAWRGERGMGLFMAAFAPSLPRPLEARQPWHHSYDQSDVAAMRSILK
jgi:hypothetical protein